MWDGHLNAVTALLNLFAAPGHIHYAKSARLYVQEMRKLPSTHPWLHQKFVEGYHIVRRSERLWAGLWTYIVIEQVLMRSLKRRGGLTIGRCMTESVRRQWVYIMYACAAILDATASLTGKHHTTSHQHVEFGEATCQHDLRDMNKFLDWFHSHDPIDGNVPQLRSLASGLASCEGDGINCDETEKVGSEIQRSLDSVSVRNATIQRRHMVHALNELLLHAPAPTNVAELHAFLGFVQYYRGFYRNLPTIIYPMNALLRRNVAWKWTNECQAAYEACTHVISEGNYNCLTYYDVGKQIRIACDASSYGIGAVISHVMDGVSERPITTESRTLTMAKRGYTQL